MELGHLRSYFTGVAAKRLSDVEINPKKSHQHELNGVQQFITILGDSKKTFRTKLIYLSDDDDDTTTTEASVTWYDARERHATRTEWRAYFTANVVMTTAAAGDLLLLARRPDDTLLLLVCAAGSTAERQVEWLFGTGSVSKTVVQDISASTKITAAGRLILANLGIDIDDGWTDKTLLEEMFKRFPDGFPPTGVFSGWAREVVGKDSVKAPDEVLLEWFATEERLFKLLERELLGRILDGIVKSHGADVDLIFDLMKSAGQRRKSRAGAALENHLGAIFTDARLKFSRQPKTEGKARPDFLFPGIKEYKSETFDTALLKMLASKSTARDRWRQILTEAERIERKHLLTLEPAISTDQLDDMDHFKVHLIVPEPLHETYGVDADRLTTLAAFIDEVRHDQAR